jgi:hypothetical protein
MLANSVIPRGVVFSYEYGAEMDNPEETILKKNFANNYLCYFYQILYTSLAVYYKQIL